MQPINVTDADFFSAISTGVVIVDFWASWCAPCKAMLPIFDQVAAEGHTVVKANIDDCPEAASQFDIRSLPTILILKDGEVKFKTVGTMTKAGILERVAEISTGGLNATS